MVFASKEQRKYQSKNEHDKTYCAEKENKQKEPHRRLPLTYNFVFDAF
jgi:hypothetical protein